MSSHQKEHAEPNKRSAGNTDEYVGKRIKLQRRFLGFSQADMAEALNLTFQQIQKYEKGVNRVSAGRLFAISGFLNVPVNYFFEDLEPATEPYIPNVDDKILQSDEAEALIKAFYSIKDKNLQKNLLAFIKSLSAN